MMAPESSFSSSSSSSSGQAGIEDAVITGDPSKNQPVVDVAFEGGNHNNNQYGSSSNPYSSGSTSSNGASLPWGAVSMDNLLAEGLALGAAFGDNTTATTPGLSARAMEAFVSWVEAGDRERGAVTRLAPTLNPRVVVAGLLGNQAGDRDGDLWRNLELRVWTSDTDSVAHAAVAAAAAVQQQQGAWGLPSNSGVGPAAVSNVVDSTVTSGSSGSTGSQKQKDFSGALNALARLNAVMEAEAKVMAGLGPGELTFVMDLLQGTYKGEAAAAADSQAQQQLVEVLDQALREAARNTGAEVRMLIEEEEEDNSEYVC
jgi:hypothetical protein